MEALRNLPRTGSPAPNLEGPDLSGKEMSLADHRGKIVILCFYGSYYSVGTLDRVKSSMEKFVDKNVVVLGVTDADTKEKAAAMSQTAGVPWRAWYDQIRLRPICDAWGVYTRPSAILIDANGTIRYKHLHVPSDELSQAVRQLVKETDAEK